MKSRRIILPQFLRFSQMCPELAQIEMSLYGAFLSHVHYSLSSGEGIWVPLFFRLYGTDEKLKEGAFYIGLIEHFLITDEFQVLSMPEMIF